MVSFTSYLSLMPKKLNIRLYVRFRSLNFFSLPTYSFFFSQAFFFLFFFVERSQETTVVELLNWKHHVVLKIKLKKGHHSPWIINRFNNIFKEVMQIRLHLKNLLSRRWLTMFHIILRAIIDDGDSLLQTVKLLNARFVLRIKWY